MRDKGFKALTSLFENGKNHNSEKRQIQYSLG